MKTASFATIFGEKLADLGYYKQENPLRLVSNSVVFVNRISRLVILRAKRAVGKDRPRYPLKAPTFVCPANKSSSYIFPWSGLSHLRA